MVWEKGGGCETYGVPAGEAAAPEKPAEAAPVPMEEEKKKEEEPSKTEGAAAAAESEKKAAERKREGTL